LHGLEAIQAHNGWAMAITGAIIVMMGLSVLAFIISQLHRLIDIIEKRKVKPSKAPSESPVKTVLEPQAAPPPLSDMEQVLQRMQPLTLELGDTFDITTLYQVFIQNDDPHPHLTIRTLREKGYLVPCGNDLFSWNVS
jgi:hypothetical protein